AKQVSSESATATAAADSEPAAATPNSESAVATPNSESAKQVSSESATATAAATADSEPAKQVSSESATATAATTASNESATAVSASPKALHEVFSTTIRHTAKELAPYPRVFQQYEFRRKTILNELAKNKFQLQNFAAVIGRGGMVKPIPSGTYKVNDLMIKHLSEGYGGEHASNLGGLLAHSIASQIPGCQAFIADPVVVDELHDVARITGFPEIKRRSILHTLNQKAIAKRYAEDCSTPYNQLNLIVVHMGGGVSVGAHCQGRIIDVNDALQGDGPIGPERAGSVPAMPLAVMCFSGEYTYDEIRKKIAGKGGMLALSGTNSFVELCNRMQAETTASSTATASSTTTGSTAASSTATTSGTSTASTEASDSAAPSATTIYNAMAYTIAKEIGAMAAVLKGRIDAILFTGGIAHNKPFIETIKGYIGFLAPCRIYPGEDEMHALATNALNALTGHEKPMEYL
ncbi:MAG: butyrate kinase, partial [Bacteroidales bacterium]|nr:butyrate kinase [Bacteroidales bacterium]